MELHKFKTRCVVVAVVESFLPTVWPRVGLLPLLRWTGSTRTIQAGTSVPGDDCVTLWGPASFSLHHSSKQQPAKSSCSCNSRIHRSTSSSATTSHKPQLFNFRAISLDVLLSPNESLPRAVHHPTYTLGALEQRYSTS